ncbi:L,D-transpeptidase family protein, partial [Hyphomicrobium sp.]|uniref:L,D-transpeptidase family protein n=1 Tax=Hyphomicrobium sp. TaxID=82 RepID=UPI0025C111AA
MRSQSHSFVTAKTAVCALGVLLLTLASLPAAAQRQRIPPPEPSFEPWISPAAVEGLQRAIAAYQGIVAAGGWPTLPNRITLRPGDSDANVAILRRRLEMTGDVRTGGDSYMFDDALEAGVKRYQLRNGLEPTGIVYGITQRALNVPADTRLRQLQLNLARMQELLPKLAEPRFILMNSASFELQGIAGGRVEVASRTIAGKRATPTPVVSASVQAINLLPYWHVPGSIAKAALIPAVRKDPSYLYREHIRVFSAFGGEEIDPSLVNWWGPEADRYVFRQDPGPHNALGLLRFDMPNKHIVYLHDTPMKNLFDYFERAYSAGCVRTQNYLDVAEWVLAGQEGWTRPALEAAIGSGRAKTIKVARPVPVH